MKGSRTLYPALLKTVLLPPLATYVAVRAAAPRWWIQTLAYLLSFPVLYILRSELSLFLSTRKAKHSGCQPIPRVRGKWPLNLDVLRDWARSGEEEAGYMIRELEKQFGRTFNTRVLGEDQIITSDPKVMRHVLVDQFDNFVKGDKFQERARDFLGDGIFNSDGERWKFHRSLTRPFFHPSHVNASAFAPLISRFMQDLPANKPFDIQARFQILTTQVSLRWMCGEDISLDEAKAIGNAMTVAQRVVGRRVKIGTVWPLFELWKDPLQEPMTIIREFIRARIEQAKRRRQERPNSNEGDNYELHLIDRLVESTHHSKLVEDQLINILLASRDTTSSLLTFCVYALCEHPDVAGQLRKEVSAVAGMDGNITKEVIRDCKYTRCFMNEVLRMYPPVPLNIRRSVKSSLLPTSDGQLLYMPANTSIILSTIVMQTSTLSWGPTAKSFDPERWQKMSEERENFMAWHLGPRMCLGQPFALTVAHTFLILLFRHLEIASPLWQCQLRLAVDEGSDGEHPDTVGTGWRKRFKADVVLAIKDGLWVAKQLFHCVPLGGGIGVVKQAGYNSPRTTSPLLFTFNRHIAISANMKRLSSESDPRSSPGLPAPQSPSKKAKAENGAAQDASPKRTRESGGGLDTDKREALMAEIIAEGIKALGTANLATKYGVSPTIMKNCIQAGRKGNLRDKAIKAVRGDTE